jgi:hypothetical protein
MSTRTFRIVFRSSAPVCLRRSDFVRIGDIGTSFGSATAELFTSYVDLGIGAPVPRELTVVIHGDHSDLNAAHKEFHLMATTLANLVSIAANSSIGSLETYAILETTTGVEEREAVFFDRPAEHYDGHLKRLIRSDELGMVLPLLPACTEKKRLSMAAQLYQLALDHWANGGPIVPLSFLFMAAEALTPALVRQQCEELGMDKVKLAESIGIDVSRDRWEAQFRRVLVFKADEEVHRLSKRTSDGIEHGFGELGQIRRDSRVVILRLFGYVRDALLTVLGVDEAHRDQLAAKTPFDYKTAQRLLYLRFAGGDQVLGDPRWCPTVSWAARESEARELADGSVDVLVKAKIESDHFGDMQVSLLRPEMRGLQSLGSDILEFEDLSLDEGGRETGGS